MPLGSGRIKAGEGTLTGNAGEYYVVAELLKRGIVAALVPRNTPAFDVLAMRNGRTAQIRVKTKTEDYDEWQWVVKKDGTVFRSLSDVGDFTVLVNLAIENRDLRFYVVPTKTVNVWLKEDFEKWLATPGKHGRAHDPTNTKRHLSEQKHAEDLAGCLNAWHVLLE